MAERREDIHDKKQRDALKSIERVQAESEVVGTSAFRRTADRARDHFGGADADPNDPIEILGKRIGRGLSLVFLVGLVYYLWPTYF